MEEPLPSDKELALLKELNRVRKLNKELKAELARLKKPIEDKKMKLAISQDTDFRRQVAEKIVEISSPEYNSSVRWYANPVEGQIYYKEPEGWCPWADDEIVVPIEDLAHQEHNDFSPEIDIEENDLFQSMAIDWMREQEEREQLEDNGDLPEWVLGCKAEIKEFVLNGDNQELREALEEQEQQSWELAVDFALREFKNEVEVEVEE